MREFAGGMNAMTSEIDIVSAKIAVITSKRETTAIKSPEASARPFNLLPFVPFSAGQVSLVETCH